MREIQTKIKKQWETFPLFFLLLFTQGFVLAWRHKCSAAPPMRFPFVFPSIIKKGELY